MGDSDKNQPVDKTAGDIVKDDAKKQDQSGRPGKESGDAPVARGAPPKQPAGRRPGILQMFLLALGVVVLVYAGYAAFRALQSGGGQEPPITLNVVPVPQEGDVEVINSPLDKFLQSTPHDTVTSPDGKAEVIIPKDAEPAGWNPADVTIKYFDRSTAGYKIGGMNPAMGYAFESKGTVLLKPAYLFFNVANEPPGSIPAVMMYSSEKDPMPLAAQVFPKAGFNLAVALNVVALNLGGQGLTILVWELPPSVLSPSTGGAPPAEQLGTVTLPNPGDQTIGTPFNETATLGAAAVADIAGYWSHSEILSGPAALSSPAAGASSVSGMFQCNSPGAALIEYAAIYSWNQPVLNQKTGQETTEHFGDTYWGTTGAFSCLAAIGSSGGQSGSNPQSASSLDGTYAVTLTTPRTGEGDARPLVVFPYQTNLLLKTGLFAVSGPAPWVTVTGPLNADGTFDAMGTGTVAGHPNIGVEFKGQLTTAGLAGSYTLGLGGGLPKGQTITYAVHGARTAGASVPAAPAAPANGAGAAGAAIPGLQDFLAQLTAARRTNDAAFLFAHLHPAAIGLYSAPVCQAHFQQRSPDPTYNLEVIDVTGPASWVYAPPGQAQTPVENVYTVNANETQLGKTTTAAVHIGQTGDQFYWFTACK